MIEDDELYLPLELALMMSAIVLALAFWGVVGLIWLIGIAAIAGDAINQIERLTTQLLDERKLKQ
jgi:hypothetical protein